MASLLRERGGAIFAGYRWLFLTAREMSQAIQANGTNITITTQRRRLLDERSVAARICRITITKMAISRIIRIQANRCQKLYVSISTAPCTSTERCKSCNTCGIPQRLRFTPPPGLCVENTSRGDVAKGPVVQTFLPRPVEKRKTADLAGSQVIRASFALARWRNLPRRSRNPPRDAKNPPRFNSTGFCWCSR